MGFGWPLWRSFCAAVRCWRFLRRFRHNCSFRWIQCCFTTLFYGMRLAAIFLCRFTWSFTLRFPWRRHYCQLTQKIDCHRLFTSRRTLCLMSMLRSRGNARSQLRIFLCFLRRRGRGKFSLPSQQVNCLRKSSQWKALLVTNASNVSIAICQRAHGIV